MRMRQTICTALLTRHIHAEAYAALVLSGGYEEAGDHGRFKVNAGDVVFHDRFEAHLDRFCEKGAEVLNLRLARGRRARPGIAKVADPDAVARAAEKSCRDAVDLLFSNANWRTPKFSDWPDELVAILIESPSVKLAQWAEENRLAPWTVSRGFAQVFGVSPEVFRARARARQALKSIEETSMPLATIAAELGFADQSHMTRSVRQLTGVAPQAWRLAANGFKTGTKLSV
jgi:AraC-like DNA-binding protein